MRPRRFLLPLSLIALAPLQAYAHDADQQREPNINAPYIVERVTIRGVRDRDVPASLADVIRAAEGGRLDSDAVGRLETRIREAFPEHLVNRRTVRGRGPGRVRLIFEIRRADWARWLRFEPQDANLIYHSDQGWGAQIPLSVSIGDLLISPRFSIDVGDDLIEEYGGFGLRIESRRLGTERLAFLFDWSDLDPTWREATVAAVAANPGGPTLYGHRRTVSPVLKFALTRHLSVHGGVRITELDPLKGSGESRMANAALGAVNVSVRPRESLDPWHGLEAAFTVRAGTTALESDLVYERYLAVASYTQRRGRQHLVISGLGGRIDGDAPLFERFSLGDSRTLRGWDKYEIAPAGGDRVVYGSVEYRYRGLGVFVDAGSVWDTGADRRLRVSTGLTATPGPMFFTLGFPVNTDRSRAVFTMGLRFAGPGIQKY